MSATNYDYTKMFADKVVIIDTYNVYLYDQNRDSVMKIYDLDDLKEESDVQALRKTIVGLLSNVAVIPLASAMGI